MHEIDRFLLYMQFIPVLVGTTLHGLSLQRNRRKDLAQQYNASNKQKEWHPGEQKAGERQEMTLYAHVSGKRLNVKAFGSVFGKGHVV